MAGSAYLTPFDSNLLKQVEMYLYYVGRAVEFQFPPKISADSRKMNWTEHPSGWGTDPTANFAGNGPRELSLKIEYIVESDVDDFFAAGNAWTIAKVKYNINLLKGIFTGFREDPGQGEQGVKGEDGGVLVRFKYPLLTGFEPKTFRVGVISVDYSDEIVSARTSGVVVNYSGSETVLVSHPLKSIVTMGMSTYNVGSDEEPNQDWELASVFPSLEELWY